MMLMVLAQQIPYQWKEQTTSSYIIAGILVGVFAIILIIGSRSGSSKGSGSRSRGGASSKKYSKRAFHKQATKAGLTRNEVKLLENLCKKYNTSNPMSLLNNSKQLDRILGQIIDQIDNSDENQAVRESRKSMLFNIKQKVERSAQSQVTISGTRQLKQSQPLAIAPSAGGRFPSRVIVNMSKFLGVDIPTDPKGRSIRLQKGTRVTVFFWKPNGMGYSFTTRVMGYSTSRGITTMMLQHSRSVNQARQRQYRRRDVERPAYFTPVSIETTGHGRNRVSRTMVDTKSASLGTLLNLSAGGCAIRSNYSLGAGSLIRMEFNPPNNHKVTVYGKVLSLRRMKPIGGIMHIRFTRVSRDNLNRINAFVYDFPSETTHTNENPWNRYRKR